MAQRTIWWVLALALVLLAGFTVCTRQGQPAQQQAQTEETAPAEKASPDSGKAPVIYYAATNLRLRSEPDTSTDNRIASIPEGSSVEFIEAGKPDTVNNITAPWFKVKMPDGTIGWVFSGYLQTQEQHQTQRAALGAIVGEWLTPSNLYYRYDKNGNYAVGYYEGEIVDSGTYTVKGDTIIIGDNVIGVGFSGNTLTLTYSDGSSMTLTRL
jgi:uncharacterized protein YgiM (DUF1202 family)